MTNFSSASIGNTVLLAALVLITVCGGGASGGDKASPAAVPTVTSTSPANIADEVAVDLSLRC